jgi:radical SAM protein with 4Fe4S-binding SPASM domain
MRQKVYDDVMTKLDTPINESYEKTLFLYREHMLSTAFGDFDIEKFKFGLSTLTVSDNIRGNEHMDIVHDFIDFFKLHELDPSIPNHALTKVEKLIQKLPESFCSVPWLQIHTEPDGKVFPCCYYSHAENHKLGNWNDQKIKDIFHGDKWNELRKDFLDGNKPSACTRCWKEEDSGIMSMRQRFNERYRNFPDYTNQNGYDKYTDIINETNSDGSVKDIKLATIDLIFNNLCNMKCRTCGPGLSTSWIADEIKLGRSKINPVSLLTNETVTHMKDDLVALVEMVDPYTEIHFSGGEPMMQEDHYQFLQLLLDMGKTKVKIRYNTNMTVYTLKDYNAFEMLQHFDNVFIVGSCDAMGKQGEYIRKGFDWEEALQWLKTCKEYLPDADYGVSAVYSLLNASAAVDFHRYMCESTLFKRSNGTNFGFYLNTLHDPTYLKTTLLPPDVKLEVTEKITKHIEWLTETQPQDFHYAVYIDHWKNAITLMNSADHSGLIPHFYRETHLLDGIRNEVFEDVFPELHEKMKPYDK